MNKLGGLLSLFWGFMFLATLFTSTGVHLTWALESLIMGGLFITTGIFSFTNSKVAKYLAAGAMSLSLLIGIADLFNRSDEVANKFIWAIVALIVMLTNNKNIQKSNTANQCGKGR